MSGFREQWIKTKRSHILIVAIIYYSSIEGEGIILGKLYGTE